jgi:heat shock protein HtpX
MVNLFLRSTLVLVLLFGLLFAVGMVVLIFVEAPLWVALIFAIGIIFLQYLLGPWILQLIYKIEWRDPKSVDPALAGFIARACAAKEIPVPRFGLIHDGNPNAFTFGHYPGDARLVVTTGLVDLLDEGERQAVVAHELGHIAHWDFVVMTVAAVVPLVLYVVYRVTLSGRGRRRDKGGGYLALVGLISFLAYIVSHYIVLLLSRVREYYADQFAGEVTGEPDILSTALVKVAYGLAAAPKEEKKDDTRMVAARAFGIFDPKVAQSLALASAGSGAVSAEAMESAMKWDLWNPWAILYELRSSHPLPAKRIRALERQTQAKGRLSRFSFRAEQPESYWDEFLVDVAVNYLPLLGLLLGVVLSVVLALGVLARFESSFVLGAVGLGLLLLCAAWWLKRRFSYRHQFDETRTVRSLVSEVKVSAVRSIPCTVEGKIIGRGIPGLFYSEDLVLQDESGFIVVDYRQPIRLVEFLFGWLKAEDLIGLRGKAMGWYRRSPRPYLELRRLVFEDGETVTSYLYPVSQFFVYAGMAVGVLLLILQFV